MKTLLLGLGDIFRRFFTRRRLIVLGILAVLGIIIYIVAAKPFENTSANLRIETLQDRGAVRVGVVTNVVPFAYTDSDDTLKGFEVDLGRLIAERLLGGADKAEFVPLNATTALPALDEDWCDISIAQLYSSSDRESRYIFSAPYYTDAVALMAPSGAVESIGALNGRRIGFLNGSPVEQDLEAFAEEYGYTLELVPFASYPEIIQAMSLGKADVFCAEMAVISRYLTNKHTVLENYIDVMNYRVATLKSNLTLQEAIDAVLLELEESGELSALAQKWELGIYN